MGTPQIPSVDSDSKQFPDAVRTRIGANLNDTTSIEGAALSTSTNTIVSPRVFLRPNTVFLGDSITIGSTDTSGSGIQNQGSAWPTHMVMASQGRMRLIRNAGISGNTSAQMLARFDTDVTPWKPEVVVVVAGTNDVGADPAFANWQANMQAIVAKIRAIGAVPILGAIYPNGEASPANRAQIGELWNSWLREYCRVQRIRLIPFDRLSDPATGGWPSSYVSGDQTHPVAGGAQGVVGQFAWDSVARHYADPVITQASFNGADALTNGFMTTLGSPLTAPTISASTSTSSGSLAAGAYSYKVSTLAVAGETTPSAAVSATLTAAGTITLSWTAGPNRGFRVYRKGPNDSDYFMLASLAPFTATYADAGTAATPGITPESVDRSVLPAGFSTGFNTATVPGTGVRTDPAVRGNVFRFGPQVDGSQNIMYVNAAVTVVAGEVWEFTCKMKSPTNATHGVQIQLLGPSLNQRANPASGLVSAHDWQLVNMRFTIPAGYTSAQIFLAVLGLTDFAEFGFRKVTPVASS